jgi:hypothetical protein
MTLVKSAPKKSFAQKTDFFRTFLCTFLKSVRKDGFFDAPFDLFKEKSFHLLEGTMNFFEKGKKWKKPLKISKNSFFYKQFLDFQCPSKILCDTSNL